MTLYNRMCIVADDRDDLAKQIEVIAPGQIAYAGNLRVLRVDLNRVRLIETVRDTEHYNGSFVGYATGTVYRTPASASAKRLALEQLLKHLKLTRSRTQGTIGRQSARRRLPALLPNQIMNPARPANAIHAPTADHPASKLRLAETGSAPLER